MASAAELSSGGSDKSFHYGESSYPLNQKSKYFFSRLFSPPNSEVFFSRRVLKEAIRFINTLAKAAFSSQSSFFVQAIIQSVSLAKRAIAFLKVYKTVRICSQGPRESWIQNAYHCSNMTQSLIVVSLTCSPSSGVNQAITLLAFSQLIRSTIKLTYQTSLMKDLFSKEEKVIHQLKVSKTVITLANSSFLLMRSTSWKKALLIFDICAIVTGIAKSFCKQIRSAS